MCWYGSGDTVRVEEIPQNELLKLISAYFAISIDIDNLNIGGDISGGWGESFVHGTVTIYQPFGDLDRLANTVAVAIVSLDDLSI